MGQWDGWRGSGDKQVDPKKQLQGLKNKRAGAAFEAYIDLACDCYRTAGIANIEKTPEPVKYLSPSDNGRFVACYEKRAQPDYKGTLRGGRSMGTKRPVFACLRMFCCF